MKLHEWLPINPQLRVIRVPGGWIYESWSQVGRDPVVSSTFVPFDNEFQPKPTSSDH